MDTRSVSTKAEGWKLRFVEVSQRSARGTRLELKRVDRDIQDFFAKARHGFATSSLEALCTADSAC